jgi:DNA-binding transcriptional LysR family regulator
MLPIDLKHIAYAIAAAEHQSFRRAAEVLRVKQSMVSRRVRQLEEQTGLRIFDRSSSGVQPTLAGTDFLRKARHLVDDANLLFAIARDVSRGKAGWITIGYHNTTPSAQELHQVLSELRAFVPDVTLRLIEDVPEQLASGLETGTIDVMITHDEPCPSCQSMPLWQERLMVAIPGTNPLAMREDLRCADLRGERFLVSHRSSPSDTVDRFVSKLAAPGGFTDIVTHAVAHNEMVSLVRIGCGLTLLSESRTTVSVPGVVYRSVLDGITFQYRASWNPDNKNPLLAQLLRILQLRYPDEPPRRLVVQRLKRRR